MMQNEQDMIPTSVVIPKRLWEEAKRLAIEEKTSLAALIRQGLEMVIQKLKKN